MDKLHHLPLNLQQGFIHTNKSNTINTVCAIYQRAHGVVVIRPEYRDYYSQIMKKCKEIDVKVSTVMYGNGFGVDTWDECIKDYGRRQAIIEQEKRDSGVYFQPAEIKEDDEIFSFQVYKSLDAAKRDFPGRVIAAYSGDDIENPTFLD